MGDSMFCMNCGAKLGPDDVFCESCGQKIEDDIKPTIQPNVIQNTQPNMNANKETPKGPFREPFPDRPSKKGNGSIIAIIALLVIAMFGGGYWFLSQKGDNDKSEDMFGEVNTGENSSQTQKAESQPNDNTVALPSTPQLDLATAKTYLSTPGYKYTFFVNYPDGMSGVVERFSGLGTNTNEAVIVSEVEVVRENGEDFGYGFHYVTREDGSYYILDSTPFEIYPHLKDGLSVGKTWNYHDETFGDIIWTVLEMDKTVDLGFEKFDNCLVVKEDNQAASFVTIGYYSPGHGMIYSTDESGNNEFYKMTAKEQIGTEQAEAQIIKWCPNYLEIKDDRSQ